MMASALEKELRLIRERLDSIEDALAEEMSDEDNKARSEALKEHKEGKTIPSSGKENVEVYLSTQAKKSLDSQRTGKVILRGDRPRSPGLRRRR